MRTIPARCGISILLGLIFFFAAGARSEAQTAVDGAIGGTVMDSTGAVVSGAKVVVRNTATNAEQIAQADSSGYFRVIHLQPGSYAVAVTATGFSDFKAVDLTVQVGLLTDLEARLTRGLRGTTVEVTGAAPLVKVQIRRISRA